MRRRAWYIFGQGVARHFQRLFLGFRTEGIENVPLDGACILAANHKSYLDPPAVSCALRREIRYFAKKELFRLPLLGPLIRSYGAVPVDRGSFDRKTLRTMLGLLSEGEALLLFPEGTRIRRPGFGPAKEGVALLAAQAKVPVVPVRVSHTWEPERSLFRRIPVVVRYGEPIVFSEDSGGADRRTRYAQMAAQVMAAIEALGVEEGQNLRPR